MSDALIYAQLTLFMIYCNLINMFSVEITQMQNLLLLNYLLQARLTLLANKNIWFQFHHDLKTVIEVITSQCHKGEQSSKIESDHPHITILLLM